MSTRDDLIKACGQEYARGHARSDAEMRLEAVLRRLAEPSEEMIEAGAKATDPVAWEWEGTHGATPELRETLALYRTRARERARAAWAAALRAV